MGRLGTCFHLTDHGSARLTTDKIPDCVNGLAVFISRQCANKLSVPLQPTSYKLQHLNYHEDKLAVNHPIYQHFTSDEFNKFHNCNHCSNYCL